MINDIKRRLIFVFHILDDLDVETLEDNLMYKVHFKCLEYYASIFNEVILIITANDLDNKLIYDAEYRLSTMFNPFCNIKFIIEQNNIELREGLHFYNYVLKKLDEYDGLTFFGHTKGVYNYNIQNINDSDWVIALYNFNLSNVYDMENKLLSDNYYIYAGLYMSETASHTMPFWFPAGSFYWMNCQKISKYIKDNHLNIDNIIYTGYYRSLRYVAEVFFPKLFDKKYIAFLDMSILKNDWYSSNYPYIKFDLYTKFDEYAKETLSYINYIHYLKFKDEITTNI